MRSDLIFNDNKTKPVTHTEMLKSLMRAGSNMRIAQKGYFTEKDPLKKKGLLALSKQYEKEFDTLLFNLKQLIN
jgi:hypothetical protein